MSNFFGVGLGRFHVASRRRKAVEVNAGSGTLSNYHRYAAHYHGRNLGEQRRRQRAGTGVGALSSLVFWHKQDLFEVYGQGNRTVSRIAWSDGHLVGPHV